MVAMRVLEARAERRESSSLSSRTKHLALVQRIVQGISTPSMWVRFLHAGPDLQKIYYML